MRYDMIDIKYYTNNNNKNKYNKSWIKAGTVMTYTIILLYKLIVCKERKNDIIICYNFKYIIKDLTALTVYPISATCY